MSLSFSRRGSYSKTCPSPTLPPLVDRKYPTASPHQHPSSLAKRAAPRALPCSNGVCVVAAGSATGTHSTSHVVPTGENVPRLAPGAPLILSMNSRPPSISRPRRLGTYL